MLNPSKSLLQGQVPDSQSGVLQFEREIWISKFKSLVFLGYPEPSAEQSILPVILCENDAVTCVLQDSINSSQDLAPLSHWPLKQYFYVTT